MPLPSRAECPGFWESGFPFFSPSRTPVYPDFLHISLIRIANIITAINPRNVSEESGCALFDFFS